MNAWKESHLQAQQRKEKKPSMQNSTSISFSYSIQAYAISICEKLNKSNNINVLLLVFVFFFSLNFAYSAESGSKHGLYEKKMCWTEAWTSNIHFVVFILTIRNAIQCKWKRRYKKKESKTIRFNHYRIFFTEIIKTDSSKNKEQRKQSGKTKKVVPEKYMGLIKWNEHITNIFYFQIDQLQPLQVAIWYCFPIPCNVHILDHTNTRA